MPALERLQATRIVAIPAVLDVVPWPDAVPVLRVAPDEVLAVGTIGPGLISDPHAIVAAETGLFGVWMERAETRRRLAMYATWQWSGAPKSVAQGAVAGLPVKVWFEVNRALWIVPEPFAADFEERLS